MLANFFDKSVNDAVIARIQQLTPESKALRGKMSVAQMLAHCSVSFEYGFEPEKHPRPNRFMRLLITLMAKKMVVSDTPFPHNGRTAPDMVISDERDFAFEKARLMDFISRVQAQGANFYDGLESHSFGKLTRQEWSNLFYKHLDHHLKQFGV
ncbi:MAG: hypothetical protein RL023_738 [Candidatus Parcubacteria bacterium]|jgi:hypothetical protein